MAIELITGRAGTPHVDSADVGAMNAALFGEGVYILDGASAELVDANNVRIAAGELLAEGRHIRITGSGETLALANGLSAYNRNDIIAAKYLRDGSGIETVSLIVIKGSNASGTPADPAMPTSGKLIDGASEVYWPLYRVTVNGLTPQAPVMVASSWAAYVGADAIFAEGVTAGWRWTKYANGLMLGWYDGYDAPWGYPASVTSAGGALYKTSEKTIGVPLPFTAPPLVLTDVRGYGNSNQVSVCCSNVNADSITASLISLSSVPYYGVAFLLIGKWK